MRVAMMIIHRYSDGGTSVGLARCMPILRDTVPRPSRWTIGSGGARRIQLTAKQRASSALLHCTCYRVRTLPSSRSRTLPRHQTLIYWVLERGCVEDQPQHAGNALRLTLCAQPRSDGMFTTQPSGEKFTRISAQ